MKRRSGKLRDLTEQLINALDEKIDIKKKELEALEKEKLFLERKQLEEY
jgi:hypothetical protein